MLIKSLDQSIKRQRRFGATFLTIFSSVISILLLIVLVAQQPELWHFRFSWYALIPAFGLALNLGIILLVSRTHQSAETLIRFNLLLLGIIILGVSQTMLMLSSHAEMALFWRDISLIGAIFTPIALLVFVFNYTGRHSLQHYMGAIVAIITTSMLMLFLGLTTDLIYVNQASEMLKTYYGFEVNIGPASIIYFLWIQVLLLLALIELIQYRRLSSSGAKSRQAQVFIYSIIFLLVSTSINEVILPTFDIVVLPLGSILGGIMAIFIAYGMTMEGIFTLNPATLVPNILDTMADAVIVTDPGYTVIYTNKFTMVHLQLQEHKMIGHSIGEFLEEATFNKIKDALSKYDPAKEIAIIDQGEIKTDNYEQRYVDISLSKVMENAQLVGYIFSFANSSEPKFRADLDKSGLK